MPTSLRGLTATLAVLVISLLAASSALAAKQPRLQLEVLSSRADLVTGEDALIGVQVPPKVKVSAVKVRRNGRNVTGAFAPSSTDPRQLVGMVEDLRAGANRIAAKAPKAGKPAERDLYDSPIFGPVFSGTQQTPFFCRTEDAGLGPATDASCSAPTAVEYRYRSTSGGFRPLADPTQRPADLAQATTRDGRTVDYVVRIESGVINRSIYRWAILAPGGDLGGGWNDRFIYSFGGGCGAGHQQGNSGIGTVLDDRQLSRGYSVISSSLTVLGTACNDVLSAETVSMVKEHVSETLGAPPVWTLGDGGSGGSIQQQMIAQNYPGLLDGLMPGASFPDSSQSKNPDCRLLQTYFATPDGSALSNAEKAAVTGLFNGPSGCIANGIGADVINASEGCDESVVPPAQIFDASTNPNGIRCTIWDSMINIYGRSPGTGYARRTLDNVGVQYGLEALQEGEITTGQFLDLNEQVGGFDENGNPRPQRSVADPDALATMYRTGRLNVGGGGVPDVPIVDIRDYVDEEPTNVHQYISTYEFRQRLLQTNGTYGNHVMLRAKGNANTTEMRNFALDLAGDWLDRIEADDSDRPLSEKVIADRPENALDACWIGGQRIVDPATIGDTGICTTTYAPHSLPEYRAGKPLGSLVAKCQLRPTQQSDYPPLSPAQRTRLATIFPDGVCDYSKPGVSQQPLGGTWISFGPDQRVKDRKRKIKLESSTRRPRAGRKVTLTASLRPCPEVTWQEVRFEQRKRGKWRKVGAEPATGGHCRARLRLRFERSAKVRVTSKESEGYAGAKSKRIRIKPR